MSEKYYHGVRVIEEGTALPETVTGTAGMQVVIGTAPVNMTDPKCVNKPILAYSYEEAVAALGYVPPAAVAGPTLKKHEFTLCEAIKAQFSLLPFADHPCERP